MRLLSCMARSGLVLLLTMFAGTASYGQACVRWLNVTDGSDLNDGLTSTTAWQSFEFAYKNAPDGCVVRTAAGEYFQGDDNDGIQLSGSKNLIFEINTFGGSDELRFPEDVFTLNLSAGKTVVIRGGTATNPTVYFGDGVINDPVNFPSNRGFLDTITITSGTLDIQVPVTIDAFVTTINRNTAGSFIAGNVTYAPLNRAINITGSVSATAGAELPPALAAGTVTISTTAGTYTSNKSHTLSDGGTLQLTGAGHVVFASVFTVTSGGTAAILNTGPGTLAFNGGLVVNATGSVGNLIANLSTGSISMASTTFNHQGAANGTGGDHFTATILNGGTGTITTGRLTDNPNTDPGEGDRVLVTTNNVAAGTFNVGGGPSVIRGDLLNAGTFNLLGDVLLTGNLVNPPGATINTNTFTLSLAGGRLYDNDGDITGNGTVELQATATLGANPGTGGRLPNVYVSGGHATLDALEITGSLTIDSAGSNNTVKTTSGITGDLTITNAGSVTVSGPSIGGNTSVAAGTVTIEATTFGGNVSTSGSGTLTLNAGAPLTIAGNLTAGSSGQLTHTPGTATTISGNLNLHSGTLLMNDSITVNGNLTQTGGTLNFNTTAHTLTLKGHFTRTGGTVLRGNGTLRFTGGQTQTLQGGPNLILWTVEVLEPGTRVVLQDGSLDIEQGFTIGSGASVDLGTRAVRLAGQNAVMTNDGSYTAAPDGAVVFGCTETVAGAGNCAATLLNQRLRGNGLYGNLKILQVEDAANVRIDPDPGHAVVMSGILTFQVGGIDLNGRHFDLSSAGGTPLIRRNLGNAVGPDARPDGSDGGWFTDPTGQGTFNASGIAYDIEYFGTLTADVTVSAIPFGIWAGTNVRNVSVITTGPFSVLLNANHSFAGSLTVAATATLDLNGFTLTSTGTNVTHLVAGTITGDQGMTISGSGSLGGGGTISSLTINTPPGSTFTVKTLRHLHHLNVNSGRVSLGFDPETDNPASPGNIDRYNQTGGDVTLTTAVDIGEKVSSGVFNLTGGTFNNASFDVNLYNTALTSDDPASFVDGGTGAFIYRNAGTLNNNLDGDVLMTLPPRLVIQAGAGAVTLTGNAGVTNALIHTTGNLDLNGHSFFHRGTTWHYEASADNYGTAGTFVINGAVTALLNKDVTLPGLTKNSTETFTLTGPAGRLTVATRLTLNNGTINQGNIDLVLSGSGTVFDYNGGTLASTGGRLVFDAGTAQTMTFAAGLDIPHLHLKNDLTADGDRGSEVFNVSGTFTFGENDSDLLFADANTNISFSEGAVIKRNGPGTIVDNTGPRPRIPRFPDTGLVDVWYLAPVTTDTELPSERLGTLRIDPGTGHVLLDKAVTVGVALELLSGNLNTNDSNTITMAEGGTVLRARGTLNDDNGNGLSDAEDGSGNGTNIQGTSYTLVYDVSGGDIVTQSGEYPEGPAIALQVVGAGHTLTLHAGRRAASLEVTWSETMTGTAPLFDLNGFDLTVTGAATVTGPAGAGSSGTLVNTRNDRTSTLHVGGNLTVGAGTAIGSPDDPEPNGIVSVNATGDVILQGDYHGGTISVAGKLILGGRLHGALVAAGDVELTTGVLNATSITFNGFRQQLTLNGDVTADTITLAQSPDAEGNQPYVMLATHRADVIAVGTVLNLNGGLFITGPNNRILLPTPTSAQGFTRNPPAGVQSHVVGNVSIFVPAGTPGSATAGNGRFEYPVGSMAAYRMAAITFEDDDPAITGATITVRHVDQRPEGLVGFPIHTNGQVISGTADFYWLITSSVGFGTTQAFNLEFLAEGFTGYDDVRTLRIVRRLARDVVNPWTLQEGTYDNFNTGPSDTDPLVRVTGTQGGLVPQGALFSFGIEEVPGLAFLQVIHAAAHPDLAEIDIYLGDDLALNDFAYRHATPVFALDVSNRSTGPLATFHIGVAPGNSTGAADTLLTRRVELAEGQTSPLLLLDDGGGSIRLLQADAVRTRAADPTSVDLLLVHGVSDAPAVDVRLFQGSSGQGPLVLAGLDFTEDLVHYRSLDPQVYTLEFLETGTTEQVFASRIDLSGLDGEAVLAIAHGLLDPPVGREGSRGANVMVVTLAGEVRVGTVVTAGERETTDIPARFSLKGNFPNPFNTGTTILFDLPETAEVSIQVFDVLGRQVLALPGQTVEAGARRSIQLQATNLASGTYLYRLQAVSPNNTWVRAGKMTLLK
ncbi:T9SS type A sorting domain-containing protein [Rhodocaloribacter litoris]|uniref:DUF4397 domain-containing protein n=1 Tax=Rhodocaloribacter litoris TaxID=2558931 RepID=UPI00141FE4BE|nr:DUF4397 domain-containing protein [Rhodocaloribacter litoris]QXD16376.1 T9SS type A sorting domain-containing protein [Rhodocaloribacter litoris]